MGSKWAYKLVNTISERQSQNNQKSKPTYCVSFNAVDPAHSRLFASCGGRRVSVYECHEDGVMAMLQGYMDESEDEEFYTVRWSIDVATGAPLLLAGGKLGVVRLLDCHAQDLLWAVNDISVCPAAPELFLTASKDCSLRLWNSKTKTCVLVATGDGCHTNEVLSVVELGSKDFHPTDKHRFLSSGMDDTIKIWWLKAHEREISASYEYDASHGSAFVAAQLGAPIFSTHKVHWNYVDCVRWMGDLILSKSVDSRVLLWQPMSDRMRTATSASGPRFDLRGRVHLIQEFHLDDADIWFMRFALNPTFGMLACGSRTGRVFCWDLGAPSDRASRARAIMRVSGRERCTVRQTAISEDGSIVLACCDDSSICRFELEVELDQ